MAGTMRLPFYTRPEVQEVVFGKTSIVMLFAGALEEAVVDISRDAVVHHLEPLIEAKRQVGKRAVCDAARGARSVAAETCFGVEQDGALKIVGVVRLIPVPDGAVRSLKIKRDNGLRNSGLTASVHCSHIRSSAVVRGR